jgi:hypothetical protein
MPGATPPAGVAGGHRRQGGLVGGRASAAAVLPPAWLRHHFTQQHAQVGARTRKLPPGKPAVCRGAGLGRFGRALTYTPLPNRGRGRSCAAAGGRSPALASARHARLRQSPALRQHALEPGAEAAALACRWNKGALEEGTAGEGSAKLLGLLEPQYRVGGHGGNQGQGQGRRCQHVPAPRQPASGPSSSSALVSLVSLGGSASPVRRPPACR